MRESGMVSGHSTHAYRLAMIRDVYRRCCIVIDPPSETPNRCDRVLPAVFDRDALLRVKRNELRRDALGSSGWKNLKGLLKAFTSEQGRPIALRILAVLLAALAAAGPSCVRAGVLARLQMGLHGGVRQRRLDGPKVAQRVDEEGVARLVRRDGVPRLPAAAVV